MFSVFEIFQNNKIKKLEDKVEKLEIELARLAFQLEAYKTEQAISSINKTFAQIEKESPCCDSDCFATPNCPKKGVVM